MTYWEDDKSVKLVSTSYGTYDIKDFEDYREYNWLCHTTLTTAQDREIGKVMDAFGKTGKCCFLQGGGVRINNKQIKDEGYRLVDADLLDGRLTLLTAGKKNKLLLHVTDL